MAVDRRDIMPLLTSSFGDLAHVVHHSRRRYGQRVVHLLPEEAEGRVFETLGHGTPEPGPRAPPRVSYHEGATFLKE